MKKAINVRTQEQWDKVMEVFKKKGWIWIKGNSDNCISDKNDFYEVCRENTYIRYNNYFTYGNIFNIDSDTQIISFEDFLKEEGIEENPKYRKVYVSDDSIEDALEMEDESILLIELPGKAIFKYVCVSKGYEKDFNNGDEYETTCWSYIAEIPAIANEKETIKEYTMEQLQEKLGEDFKIIK